MKIIRKTVVRIPVNIAFSFNVAIISAWSVLASRGDKLRIPPGSEESNGSIDFGRREALVQTSSLSGF